MKRKSFDSIEDIRIIAKNRGSHFFDADTMRFFQSRTGDTVYKGVYFISSEKSYSGPRMYTIRKVICTSRKFDILTIGQFQQYKTRNDTLYHIIHHLR